MVRLPSLFISRRAPTFALEPGLAGPRLTALGRVLPWPEAVLVVSPHWMTPTPRVSTAQQPETIHDFGGFDPALYQLGYPAPGHAALAQRTVQHLRQAGWAPQSDDTRGLDHGAWVPLMHLFPQADVPVFQVSLPLSLDADSAWAFGQALAPLSMEGVLIVGSGSLTHGLYEFCGGHTPPGTLKRAIYSAQARRLSGLLQQVYQVGVVSRKRAKTGKSKDGYCWRFVEFGTVKMAARPFLRPAFEAKKMDAVEAMDGHKCLAFK